MRGSPAALERLTEQFAKLPGIGRKGATRLAYQVLSMDKEEALDFARAIEEAHTKIHRCRVCQNFTEDEICAICTGEARDHSVICVVENPRDVTAFERTREYRGLYHVLHGTISPLNHVGPDDLSIRELLHRVAEEDIEEVILATNPDTEGEATAMYLARLLKPFHIRVSRLAYGIPVGGQLEYIDEVTLMRALDGRHNIE